MIKLKVGKLYVWKYEPEVPFIFFVLGKIYEEKHKAKYKILTKKGLGVGVFYPTDIIEEI